MDPLSDILSLLKPRSYMSAGFDAGGDWTIQFRDQGGAIKCGAVVAGACRVSVEGVAEPALLEAGDSFVLPSGRPFRLAGGAEVPAVDAPSVFRESRDGGVARWNGGGDCFVVSSRFLVEGDRAGLLLGMLPPIVHIRRDVEQGALRWAVERMMQELREPGPGGVLVLRDLAHLVLVQALRLRLADSAAGEAGWLSALSDRRLAAAIGAIHDDPAHRWTVQALAERAGMSRSSFAERFRQTVGAAPLDYVTRWRMLLAADRLTGTGDPISVVARALGYESESAFSTAFKRVMGCSPRQYGRNEQSAEAVAALT